MNAVKEHLSDIALFLVLAVYHIAKAAIEVLLPVNFRKKDVSGNVVLITGGGGGLGRILAEKFSELGCKIVVWDINGEAIVDTVEIVKSRGGIAYGYVCDITKREAVYETAKRVERDVGKVTILVNNAGIVSGKFLLETPDHLIQKTFDVNVISHFWTTKAFLPGMIESDRGHVVTVGSLAGVVGMTKLVDYCASKFAAVGFDESLKLELESLGHRNIHTTVVCPYFIKSTGMFDGVDARLVPILEVSYVADKIVNAVVTNQKEVILPEFFKIFIWLKRIVPWPVISMFLKGLVHDAHPDHIFNRSFAVGEVKEKSDDRFPKESSQILETATQNIKSTYRDGSSFERKP